MRILWFTGVQLPALTDKGLVRAAWQEGLRKALEKYHPEVELGIASFGSKDYSPFQQANSLYYNIFRPPHQIKGRTRKIINNWKHYRYDRTEIRRYLEIAKEFNPDAIMLYGSENPFGLACDQFDRPSVLNIQGIVHAIAEHMFDGLGWSEFLEVFFSRNLLRGTGSIHQWWYKKNYVRTEDEVFRLCQNFTGRTAWDRRQTERMHPGARYFHCDEILSEPYYETAWDPDQARENIIYSTSSDALFKGAIILVHAFAELKRRGRRNIKLRIAGVTADSEPGMIIQKIMTENNLNDQVELLGRVPSETIILEMKKAAIFVLPSHIENSSNSLAEAMLMGMPCIASDAGGMTSLVDEGVNGLTYPYSSFTALADRIEQLVETPAEALKLGKAARETALNRHDPEKIAATMVDIYKNVATSQ